MARPKSASWVNTVIKCNCQARDIGVAGMPFYLYRYHKETERTPIVPILTSMEAFGGAAMNSPGSLSPSRPDKGREHVNDFSQKK